MLTGEQSVDYWPRHPRPVSGLVRHGQQTTEYRQQTTGDRQHTTDDRQQTTFHILQRDVSVYAALAGTFHRLYWLVQAFSLGNNFTRDKLWKISSILDKGGD